MQIDKSNALVLGASGGLAQALITQFLADTAIETVIAVSSKPLPENLQAEKSLLWMKQVISSRQWLRWLTS